MVVHVNVNDCWLLQKLIVYHRYKFSSEKKKKKKKESQYMVSHPETGSDSPIGSDRDRGRDTKASNKCQLFFQVLRKSFQWDTSCEEAFLALKTYLSSLPILVSPSEGELLTLYVAVSDFSTSAVLIRDKDRVQHPVYYCSRALRGAEERYPRMEKLILALVTAARKLRPYF